MDYYQTVVVEYLRADRSIFVNTECWIRLDRVPEPGKNRSWYCDALAINLRKGGAATIYLVEVSYAQKLGALFKRLAAWNSQWAYVCKALVEECNVPHNWDVRPWLFIPTKSIQIAVDRVGRICGVGQPGQMPFPLITPLEMTVPWEYRTWDREGERVEDKPAAIPDNMRQ